MNAKYWLIGCALGLTGISPSMAASADARDVVGSSHTSDSSTHDNGDVDPLGVARDCLPAAVDDSHDSRRSDNGSSRSGGVTPAPRSTSRSRLGWQSLLPGSIQ